MPPTELRQGAVNCADELLLKKAALLQSELTKMPPPVTVVLALP
jgi:hypothetical protein